MDLRRGIILLSVVGITAFSACGAEACKPVELDENLAVSCEIEQDEVTYAAEFERAGGAGWKAVFTSPETVEGLEVALFNDTCTVSFEGLTYTADRDEFPEYGMVSLVTLALEDCISGKVKCQESGNRVTETGTVEGLDFSADFKNKKLLSLEISGELTAEFK